MTEKSDSTPPESLVFGQLIESSRVIEGYTQKRLSEITKVPLKFIEGIEVGEIDDSFKLVYVKGFLSILAKTLNSDPADYLTAFKAAYPEDKVADVSIEEVTELQKVTGQKGLISNESRSPRRRWFWQGIGEKLSQLKFSDPPLTQRDSPEPSAEPKKTGFVMKWLPLALGAAAVLIFTILTENQKEPERIENSKTYVETSNQPLPEKQEAEATSKLERQSQPQRPKTAGRAEQTTKAQTDSLAASNVDPTPGTSEIVLTASEQVLVKISKDGEPRKSVEIAAGDRRSLEFNTNLQLLIMDASRVSLRFNGRNLGRLGSEGRIRKISFRNSSSDSSASL
ncbi:helix-turn-helix domain-containing protein [Oligoflexaceae bacterium]|nr:helix-turn-helix domain-containing protein [Oligoflexaceae bacterium]